MMRIIINKLSLALTLLVLLLFASCDNEEYGLEDRTGEVSEKIHFEIAVGTATATSSGVQTRVATSTDGNYTTTWDNGDEIGVYIVKGSGGLLSYGNWVDNMKMTYNNGSWTPIFPSGKEYYPTDGDDLSFYAYYPYKASVPDALNMNISVLTDQSSAASLSKSDLLSASTLNVTKGTTPVQLTFSHIFAMVELKVTEGSVGAKMSSEVVVTLESCNPNVSFNLSTKATGALGGVASVKMYRVEQSGDADYLTSYTYRAFVPAQTVTANTEIFRFSQTQGTITRTLSHKPSAHVALMQGEVKPYTITLQPTIDPNHIYAVGDYYPHKGFLIQGIVFETSNGGKNGKLVSLDEKTYVSWGNPAVDEQAAGVGNIRDQNDGQAGTKNLITKRKDQADFATTYGAFNWIYQKNKNDVNGMWYMPAKDEMQALYDVWNTDSSSLNSKLSEAGGSSIYLLGFMWTSSEDSATYAWYMGWQWGVQWNYGDSKASTQWYTQTRAISKF